MPHQPRWAVTHVRRRLLVVLLAAGLVAAVLIGQAFAGRYEGARPWEQAAGPGSDAGHALKTITLNTGAYAVAGRDTRSESIVAKDDMHIVALSHFNGVQTGSYPSDNGHVLSTSPDNPWVKWADAATGMEPTGTEGYFGYCGRDYYSECAGIQDIMWQESMPAGTYVLVQKGQTLYMHTYTGNGTGGERMYHHLVRVYYW
jgi:hypothetical protein